MTNAIRSSFTRRLGLALLAGLVCETSLAAEPNAVTIATTMLEVTDKTLEWCYRITNSSVEDAWVCDTPSVRSRSGNFEVYLADDAETLKIRRRLGVPSRLLWSLPPTGRYVRLRAGESRAESLLLPLPIRPQRIFQSRRHAEGTHMRATRVVIDIGFYPGDLPEMVLAILQETERNLPKKASASDYPPELPGLARYFGGSLSYLRRNERVLDWGEQLLVPYTDQELEGEQVLRIAVDGVRIPYLEERREKVASPDLNLDSCVRAEIEFEPSMLACFFPYANQQSLLNSSEKDRLESRNKVVVDGRQHLAGFRLDIREVFHGSILSERGSAHLVCHYDDGTRTYLRIHDDTVIENKQGARFRSLRGRESLAYLTEEIKPFDVRIRCAGSLKNLWSRLRIRFGGTEVARSDGPGRRPSPYPAARRWCDSLVEAFRWTGSEGLITRPFRCPSADKGESHYAMNPNCRPDSPAHMVLLFETESGWNQHGGPELFTFDNHDPKGGCVLLNDGTVKFIRTEEELRALRWE